jgi:ABC-type branched-subunit amino acid transport system substrate-binding protein
MINIRRKDRMKRAFKIGSMSLIGLLLLIIPFFGCAQSTEPVGQEEEQYVTCLLLVDLTGPTAAEQLWLTRGMEDYPKYVNEEKGGVDGIKIKTITVDTRYDVARVVSAYRRYRDEHKVVMSWFGNTAAVKTLRPNLEADGIVGIASGDGETVYRQGIVFCNSIPFQDIVSGMLDFIVDEWKKEGKPGAPVVGVIAFDAPAGREFTRGCDEYAKTLEEKGLIKMLPHEWFPVKAPEYFGYLDRIATGGANWIIDVSSDPMATLIARDAYKTGLLKKMKLFHAFYGPNIEGVGKGHLDAIEGNYFMSPSIAGQEFEEHPLVKQLYTKYRGGELPARGYGRGIILSLALEEAARLALKDVSYEALDGLAVYGGMKKLTGISYQGLIGPEGSGFEYSETSRSPSQWVRPYIISSGKVVPYADWRVAPRVVDLYYGK